MGSTNWGRPRTWGRKEKDAHTEQGGGACCFWALQGPSTTRSIPSHGGASAAARAAAIMNNDGAALSTSLVHGPRFADEGTGDMLVRVEATAAEVPLYLACGQV